MERLSIEEIIAHCERKTEKVEKTFRKGHLESENCGIADIIYQEYWEHRQVAEYLKELKAYRDAEEQGLFIKLPCKVGDTVWDNDYGKPCAYRITGFSFGTADGYIDNSLKETELVFYYENPSGSTTGGFVVSEIGKTVFLTQEEAEEKLAELKGNDMKCIKCNGETEVVNTATVKKGGVDNGI